MALATAATMAWGLARSALWLDEGATVVATQRSWSDLWTLRHGAEAPLLPFYVLLKVFCAGARTLMPGLENHPEVLFRLPSLVVTVLAGGALIAWLRRYTPPRLVLVSAALLLLTSGFSRFGQEARPYAGVLFLAVISTILWSVLADDPRRRWLAAYTVSIGAMVALHTLSAGLVLAHLVAALVCTETGQRWPVLWRTAVSGGLGLLLVSPLALISARNGTGPLYVYPDVTMHDALAVFVRLFTVEEHPILGVGPVILLALIGLTRVRSPDYRFIARLVACWALIPLAAMFVVLLVHPNLLFERYVLFVVPAWAILAGFGVMTVADLARAGAAALTRRPGAAIATAVAVVLIAGTALVQLPSQREIRTPGGHSEDIRPALAASDQLEYAGLKIVVSSRFGSVLVGAYAQAEETRLVTQRIQRTDALIWPVATGAKASERTLRHQEQVVLLQRDSSAPGCGQLVSSLTVDQIEACMPTVLKKLDYRVERTEPVGRGWSFALLQRDP